MSNELGRDIVAFLLASIALSACAQHPTRPWMQREANSAITSFGFDPSGRRLWHAQCPGGGSRSEPCEVKVRVGKPSFGGNDCGIDVVDVILLTKLTPSISWSIVKSSLDQSGREYQFVARTAQGTSGVVVRDNDRTVDLGFDPGDTDPPIPLPPQVRVFRDDVDVAVPRLVHKKWIDHHFDKVFTYGIRIEWRMPGGNWTPCREYDPVIVNRGD